MNYTPVPDLTQLANHYNSDKGSTYRHAHGYSAFYSFLLEQFRDQTFSMMEIGLLQGGVEGGGAVDRAGEDIPSMRMWLDFFPKAMCYGFDLSDFSHIEMPRFKFFRGDLSSEADLDNLREQLPPLKFIVDDGSHASFHQQFAFSKLFERVEPGGFYVIEDLHWQPYFESMLPPSFKTADVFQRFLTTGKLEMACASQALSDSIAAQIGNVFMHRNDRGGVDSWKPKMVAVQKKAA